MSEYRRNIFEDSWVYQEKRQEILQELSEQARQTLIDIVHIRFPQLSELAFQQAAYVSKLGALYALMVDIVFAQDVEAARKLLVDVVKH